LTLISIQLGVVETDAALQDPGCFSVVATSFAAASSSPTVVAAAGCLVRPVAAAAARTHCDASARELP
jgi:hypothetical protein